MKKAHENSLFVRKTQFLFKKKRNISPNKDCFFTVGEVTKNLKEGYVWEINNNGRRHGVANEGETDRIHLIVDWLKK